VIVRARLDRRTYPIGKKVSAKDLRELRSTGTTSMAIGATSSDRAFNTMTDRLSHSRALSLVRSWPVLLGARR